MRSYTNTTIKPINSVFFHMVISSITKFAIPNIHFRTQFLKNLLQYIPGQFQKCVSLQIIRRDIKEVILGRNLAFCFIKPMIFLSWNRGLNVYGVYGFQLVIYFLHRRQLCSIVNLFNSISHLRLI